MNHKELTKIFMMIQIDKNPLLPMIYKNIFQRFNG